jgi:hypothetical protein
MPNESFDPVSPGDMPSAREYNRLQKTAQLSDRLSSDRGFSTRKTPVGTQILDARPRRRYAKILGNGGGNNYAWQEMYRVGTTLIPYKDGVKGTLTRLPAYELAGRNDVPIGKIVEVELSPDGESFGFLYHGAGTTPFGCIPGMVFNVYCDGGSLINQKTAIVQSNRGELFNYEPAEGDPACPTVPAVTGCPDDGTVGVAIPTHTFGRSGSPLPTVTLYAGEFPPGLTYNSSNRELTGTPTEAGEFWFTMIASNIAGDSYLTCVMTVAEAG